MQNVKKIISDVVRERLQGIEVDAVDVAESVDSDGAPVFLITVVFNTKNGLLDANKTVGMVRHLRPKLADENAERFPLFRYVSKADYSKMKHEAA